MLTPENLQEFINKYQTNFTVPYLLVCLPPKEIVAGKIAALLSRGKPRDYYDLLFMLRHPQLNKFVEKKELRAVNANLERSNIDLKKELGVLLPVSQHLILKNFRKVLKSEINKYF